MPPMIQKLIDSLASKFGGLKGYIVKKLLEFGGRYLLDLVNKILRDIKQKAAEKKVVEDVKEAKPRTDEVRKNEQDFLNS